MAEFEIKQVLYRAVADKDYGKYTLVKVPNLSKLRDNAYALDSIAK